MIILGQKSNKLNLNLKSLLHIRFSCATCSREKNKLAANFKNILSGGIFLDPRTTDFTSDLLVVRKLDLVLLSEPLNCQINCLKWVVLLVWQHFMILIRN